MQDLKRRHDYTENQIDYSVYKMNFKEYVKYISIICGVAGIYSYIFYKHIVAFVLFLSPMYFYLRMIQKHLVKKRKQELTMQFKEFCLSLCAQLMTGYSIENAIGETYRELVQMFGKKAYICQELRIIQAKLKLNATIEKCFEEFANRTYIEEIILFAEIIKTAKRCGGDMIEVVRNASDSIGQRIEVEREIKIIINAKKYEQLVMNVVPIFIVLYVNVTSPGMMDIMYNTLMGRVIMSICFGFYIIAFVIGEKLTDIEI